MGENNNIIELELQEYMYNYCKLKNIQSEIRFACFGDNDKIYLTRSIFKKIETHSYYTKTAEAIKTLLISHLDKVWNSLIVAPEYNSKNAKVVLFIKDIISCNNRYKIITGTMLFIDNRTIFLI